MSDDIENGVKTTLRFVEKKAMENTERIVKLEEKHMETLLTLIDVKNVVSRVEDKIQPIAKKLNTYEDGSKQTKRAWISFLGQAITAMCAVVAAYVAVKVKGGP
jgi:chromosome segregation ATPase